MRAHNRPGALPVDVEIANVKFAHCEFNFVAWARINSDSQAELGVVGYIESVLKITRCDERQHRTEDFFLLEFRLRLDIGNYGWLNKITLAGLSNARASGN